MDNIKFFTNKRRTYSAEVLIFAGVSSVICTVYKLNPNGSAHFSASGVGGTTREAIQSALRRIQRYEKSALHQT